jgi:hypothetical protein
MEEDVLAKEDHDEVEYMPPRPVGVFLFGDTLTRTVLNLCF